MQLNLFDKPKSELDKPRKLTKREKDWVTKSFLKKISIGVTSKKTK